MRTAAVVAAIMLMGACFGQGNVVPSESQGAELTVYNCDMALVKDLRSVTLAQGLNTVRCVDVAARIAPTSVSLKSLTAPGAVAVREQSFQYDVVSRHALPRGSTCARAVPAGGTMQEPISPAGVAGLGTEYYR